MNFKSAIWTWGHFRRTICNKIVEQKPQKRMERFRLLLEHLAWIEHQFLSGKEIQGNLWGMMRGVGGERKPINQSWLAKGLGLGLLCWGFKGVQEEIPWEEASTLQIGSVAFPRWQCTCPQLHPCHPVTFGYSLSSEAVVMRQLIRRKRLWRRSLTRSHKRTSTGSSRSWWNSTTSALQPEEITSKGTRVSCVYYQWQWPYEKSLETYLMILVCMYACMYTYMYVSFYQLLASTYICNSKAFSFRYLLFDASDGSEETICFKLSVTNLQNWVRNSPGTTHI